MKLNNNKSALFAFFFGALLGFPLLLLLVIFMGGFFGDLGGLKQEGSLGVNSGGHSSLGNFRASFSMREEMVKKIGPGPYYVFMVYGAAESPWTRPGLADSSGAIFTGDVIEMGKIESFPQVLEGKIVFAPFNAVLEKATQLGLPPGLTVSFILGNNKQFFDYHKTLGSMGADPALQVGAETVLYNARAEVLRFAFSNPINMEAEDNRIDFGTVHFDEFYNLDKSESVDAKAAFNPQSCLNSGSALKVRVTSARPDQISPQFKKFRLVRVYDDFTNFIMNEELFRAVIAKNSSGLSAFYDDLGEATFRDGAVNGTFNIKRMKSENRFYKLAAVSCENESSRSKCLDEFAQNYYLKRINTQKDKHLILVPRGNEVHRCDSPEVEAIFWNDGKAGLGYDHFLLKEKEADAPAEIVRSKKP